MSDKLTLVSENRLRELLKTEAYLKEKGIDKFIEMMRGPVGRVGLELQTQNRELRERVERALEALRRIRSSMHGPSCGSPKCTCHVSVADECIIKIWRKDG